MRRNRPTGALECQVHASSLYKPWGLAPSSQESRSTIVHTLALVNSQLQPPGSSPARRELLPIESRFTRFLCDDAMTRCNLSCSRHRPPGTTPPEADRAGFAHTLNAKCIMPSCMSCIHEISLYNDGHIGRLPAPPAPRASCIKPFIHSSSCKHASMACTQPSRARAP